MDTAPSLLKKIKIQPGKFEDLLNLSSNSQIWAAAHLTSWDGSDVKVAHRHLHWNPPWLRDVWAHGRILAVVVQLPSSVQLFMTPWAAAHQVSLSLSIFWSLPKSMYTESMGGSWDIPNTGSEPGKSKWLARRNPEEILSHIRELNYHKGATLWVCLCVYPQVVVVVV